jgi:hypothetical protein
MNESTGHLPPESSRPDMIGGNWRYCIVVSTICYVQASLKQACSCVGSCVANWSIVTLLTWFLAPTCTAPFMIISYSQREKTQKRYSKLWSTASPGRIHISKAWTRKNRECNYRPSRRSLVRCTIIAIGVHTYEVVYESMLSRTHDVSHLGSNFNPIESLKLFRRSSQDH